MAAPELRGRGNKGGEKKRKKEVSTEDEQRNTMDHQLLQL